MRLPIEEPRVNGRREIPATNRVDTPTLGEMSVKMELAKLESGELLGANPLLERRSGDSGARQPRILRARRR
jgi:hypothetical protein